VCTPPSTVVCAAICPSVPLGSAVVRLPTCVQFDYGHMDFTFSAKEELGWYVMSLLMRT
jgi:hypothetical protein